MVGKPKHHTLGGCFVHHLWLPVAVLGMGPAGALVLGWQQGEKMCMCRKMVGLFRAAKAGKIVAPTIQVL